MLVRAIAVGFTGEVKAETKNAIWPINTVIGADSLATSSRMLPVFCVASPTPMNGRRSGRIRTPKFADDCAAGETKLARHDYC